MEDKLLLLLNIIIINDDDDNEDDDDINNTNAITKIIIRRMVAIILGLRSDSQSNVVFLLFRSIIRAYNGHFRTGFASA
jgi:hypothetical protein